ncbi:MAG: hypothetical protein ABI270_07965 [Nitrosospira sp.]
MARSILIAGMALGITGAVYAEGEGGGAGGAAAIGGRAGAAAGQAGSEMSGMNGALRRESSRRERAIPGLKTAEPQGIPVAGPEIPPGKRSTSRAPSRMEGTGGGEGNRPAWGQARHKIEAQTGNSSGPSRY